MSHLLRIEDLRVSVEDLPILNGVNLEIHSGEIHALMGPNGSGKSTLAYALAGHPKYQIIGGKVEIDGTDLLALDPSERARLGLFLAFQYPVTIPGVKVADFLRHAVSNVRNPDRKEGEGLIPMRDFRRELRARMEELGIEAEFARRYLNDGFSGGEKKRLEMLQMLVLQPTLAILDETDSGLDIDALRIIAQGIEAFRSPEHALLLITHYQRILNYVKPDVVHVLVKGRIVKEGGPELAHELEATGYDPIIKELATV